MNYASAIFHHVPKSAGSYVRQAVGPALKCDIRVDGRSTAPGRSVIESVPGRAFYSSHVAFHPEIFAPTKGEFYFTWVRDPVDMAYSAWYFYKREQWHIPKVDHWHLLSHVSKCKSLRQYVDRCLRDKRPFFPEGVFTHIDLTAFDFVGRAWHMRDDLAQLSELLGVEIDPPAKKKNVSGQGKKYAYRRDELAERLAVERDWIGLT